MVSFRQAKTLYPFEFQNLKHLQDKIRQLGISFPLAEDFEESSEILAQGTSFCGREIPNSLCIQPMEGCDGEDDGRPGELTFRRYRRFAAGGAGIIWVEATAVVPEGRANPRQLWINENSLSSFKKLVETIKDRARNFKGEKHAPYLVLQLTHSGRYSKPSGFPSPVIAYRSSVLKHQENELTRVISDRELDELQGKYLSAAQMAEECGFDAVDIKSCHGYLLHELLSAYTRRDSSYGGSLENRTRFLAETVEKLKKHLSSTDVTSRLNIYDGIPYPCGWGMAENGSLQPDLSEPLQLIGRLKKGGMNMFNLAVGSPYYNPHVERPYDYPIDSGYAPSEHPLVTMSRIAELTCRVSDEHEDVFIINTGFSWLRHFAPLAGAMMKKEGKISSFGLGRLALACPDFANMLFREKRLQPDKMCISCSSCSQIMRDGGKTGCVVRDGEIYGALYRYGRLNNEDYLRIQGEKCLECWEGACKEGCPADVEIKDFIDAFYRDDVRKSYEILRRKNALPLITSYVCPVEVLCEKNCLAKTWMGEPIPVHHIQRKVSGIAGLNGWTAVKSGKEKNEKIAIVGGGPAGISATVFLVEMGYRVAIFEATGRLGGMVNIIPSQRLPAGIMEKELSGLAFEETGRVEISYNSRLFKDFSPDDLFKQGFSAVLLATGLEESSSLPLKKPEGVVPALEFLFNRHGIEAGSPAAVVGGGNLAMDAAASLRKAGKEVYIIYRRGKLEMPAWPDEKREAEESGVHFMILSQPVEYVPGSDGRLKGIRIIHTRLAGEDRYGRRKPEEIPGTEYVLPVNFCVEAVGQNLCRPMGQWLECTGNGIKISSGNHSTCKKGIFAAGDAVNGGATVIRAVAEGRSAAFEMDAYLSGAS